ncbi:DNA polymerase Y family protein [Streptomyces lydicus]|uniref:DNA polymerase Y family protein n=1 Tax=Streptomyces lydicus TaxID=47763 RepID=UPI0036E88299
MALVGVDVHIGIARSWAVAAMASVRPARNGLRLVPAGGEPAFLDQLPIEALHSIGPVQAARLRTFGLETIGALAATPPVTVGRILGGKAGRVMHERARGIDPRPIVARALPLTVSERAAFRHDTLDPTMLRSALLHLTVTLGARLRTRQLAATSLSVNVVFADGAAITRSRKLRETSAHDEDLRTVAYALWEAFAFERARIRGLAVRVDVTSAAQAARQITLDERREAPVRLEPVIDRANRRCPDTVGPASAYRRTG